MKFTELTLKAKRVACKEFIVDFETFFRDDDDDFCSIGEVYRILLGENDEHEYDENGILISDGGCY